MGNLPEFIANNLLLVLSFVAVAGLLVWNIFGAGLQGLTQVEPMQAVQLINHEDAVVVDVRESSEYSQAHILNSLHIPLSVFGNQLNKLEKYKVSPLIVNCNSGHRSMQACRILKKNGYDKVYNMRGGILAWQNANLPVSKGKSK
jgi:rhodanese-related sulfurtransferase